MNVSMSRRDAILMTSLGVIVGVQSQSEVLSQDEKTPNPIVTGRAMIEENAAPPELFCFIYDEEIPSTEIEGVYNKSTGEFSFPILPPGNGRLCAWVKYGNRRVSFSSLSRRARSHLEVMFPNPQQKVGRLNSVQIHRQASSIIELYFEMQSSPYLKKAILQAESEAIQSKSATVASLLQDLQASATADSIIAADREVLQNLIRVASERWRSLSPIS